eukprot:8257876-Pyramimonas_sp.AAC.1
MAQVSPRRSGTSRGMFVDSGCVRVGGRDIELGVVPAQGRHIRFMEEVDDSEAPPCLELEQLRFVMPYPIQQNIAARTADSFVREILKKGSDYTMGGMGAQLRM